LERDLSMKQPALADEYDLYLIFHAAVAYCCWCGWESNMAARAQFPEAQLNLHVAAVPNFAFRVAAAQIIWPKQLAIFVQFVDWRPSIPFLCLLLALW